MAFHGKVCLITGAGSGMGRLAAQRLAANGATIAAIDLNEEGLRETAKGQAGIRSSARRRQPVTVIDAPNIIARTPASPDRPQSALAWTNRLCGLEISSGLSIGLYRG